MPVNVLQSGRPCAAGRIPAGFSSFVGRAAEIAEIADLLENRRLLTLTGAPGIGKSRLAVEAATRLSERYQGGRVLVELAPIGDPALIPRALTSALSIREVAGVSQIDAVLADLAERRLLLVLDNCEHLVEACAKLTDLLLSGCPQLSIVATSREPLAIAGETVWPVPALPVPVAGESLTPETLIEYEAARLFAERAGGVQVGFELTPEHVEPIAEIARRLDGIPLAIELAAARVEVLTPSEIATRLDRRFALLSKGSRSHLSRHGSLAAALDWSHDLLSEPERAVLRRLSVFQGGFGLEACQAVCGGGEVELDDEQVFHLLGRLVAKSLVLADTANSRGRYRLLETIRAYAADRLVESGEADSKREAHAHFYMALAEQAEPELSGPSQARWFDRLEGEHPNLRCAFEWSLAHGRTEWALRMGGALILFWRVRCHFTEGAELLERVLAVSDGDYPALRASALWGAGFLTFMAGDPDRAQPALEQSLAAFRELEEAAGQARALLMLGDLHYHHDLGEQLALLDASAALARQAGDMWCLAHALGMTGLAYLNRQDLPAARPFYEECRAVARETGDRQGLRYGLYGLGQIAVDQGDYASAGPLLEETLTVSRELREGIFEEVALVGLGELAFGRGDYSRAGELFEQAREVQPAAAPLASVLGPIENLGRVAHARGDRRRALELYREAEALSDPGRVSLRTLLWTAELAADAGDAEQARRRLEQALEPARRRGHRRLTAQALHGLGQIARHAGDLKRAAVLHDEALAIRRQLEEAPGVTASLEAIGGLAGEAHRWGHSARLLGAAHALREQKGYARVPWESRRYDADLALCREKLGDAGFDEAFAQGASLSIAEAVIQASKGRKRQARPSTGWSSLTETEQQVARLAAEGLTNPEIAERLFVTLTTVKTHLKHIFAKLGLTRRRELPGHVPEGP